MSLNKNPVYVLITPARNEEAYIERTIKCVVSQTVLPLRWIIVSDGSVDRTDEIVKAYAERFQWIQLLRMPDHSERHYAAKARCFDAGYAQIRSLRFDIIGNLDADITFGSQLFNHIVNKFREKPDLGVAGPSFVEHDGTAYDFRFSNIEHVSGPCQLFRRECFESIGGYAKIKGGGIDTIACTTARMKGWTTRTFTEYSIQHNRKMGTAERSLVEASFKQGIQDYSLGYHFLWESIRALYQMRYKPFVIGGVALLIGFLKEFIKRADRPVSEELIAFIRIEQITRLKSRISTITRRKVKTR